MSRAAPLQGIVAHICETSDFEAFRVISEHVVGTSNRKRCTQSPQVINDEYAIGRMGANYLASRGLKNLFFVNRMNMLFSQQRAIGFLETAKQHGLNVECLDFGQSFVLGAIAAKLLDLPPPIGVMTDSDLTARILIEKLPNYKTTVPNKIAILGVDDDLLQNSLAPIALSSIKLGGYEIGFRAAELICQLNSGLTPPQKPILVRPIRVIERASTNSFAVSDPLVFDTLKYLRNHISSIKDVNDLVQGMKVNRRTLEMRFRKALNRSINSELTEARLQRARELLESTELTITEIAELVGYSEYRLLTLAFQRLTGEPPSAYRKRVRGG
jgi:LacI family transcriptional regulator